MNIVSPAIRNSAKGQTCTVRLYGCDGGTETTVFAHLPVGMKGMACKSPDLFGVYACVSCHDAIDGRGRLRPSGSDLLRALAETQMRMFAAGILRISDDERKGAPRQTRRRSKGRTAAPSKIIPHSGVPG